ncbi:MAG TPA: HD domain-containing protein [Thermoanaerobaculia bacterium]|nr:HD domain-containing protein [Thermoanaerobaculia bacterium]HUM29195.1 HD domain-containing protein [Thermoanaerobaculia bacterium]HXK67574.1 HD domain-containing protein [Thermoanaerobaculia bacterium]
MVLGKPGKSNFSFRGFVRFPSDPIIIVLIAFVYAASERVAQLEMFHLIPGVTLFYPTAAITILAFYFFGPMAALGIILGCIASPWSPGMPFLRGILKGLIHSTEGFLPFWVISRLGADARLYRHNTMSRFLILGLVGGTFLDAAFGNIYQLIRYNVVQPVNAPIPTHEIPLRFFAWWTSDLLAALCLALPLILIVRPFLTRIPETIRKNWFHPVHSVYFPRPLYQILLTRGEVLKVGIVMVFLFTGLFIAFPRVIIGTSWYLMLLAIPMLFLAFRGGLTAAVAGCTVSTFISYLHIFPRYDHDLGVVPIVNAVATLILLNILGFLTGFFTDGVRSRITISRRIQRYTESLMESRSQREVFSHLASALIDVLGLKSIVITGGGKTTRIPEDPVITGKEPTLDFLIPPSSLSCVKWDRDTISQRDDHMANNLVQQARIALKNQELTDDLQETISDLKLVFATTAHTLETLDMDVLLEKVFQTLRSHVDISIAKIYIYDTSARMLRLRSHSGIDADRIKLHALTPGQGIVGIAFLSEEVVYAPQVGEHPDYIAAVEGIASETAIPLRVEEGIIGVLDLQGYKADPFSARDLELLKTISANLAFAVHQSDLHGALSKAHELLQTTYFDTVETLCNAIEAKDNYTEGHVERTATFATELGISMGMKEDEVTTLRLGAMLHDIGKIGVPEAILQKPKRLDRGEREKMKEHTTIGVNILKNIEFIRLAIPIIQHHHEWFSGADGQENFGYPEGISGESIPLGARIVAVVDAFDAMTTSRPYRHALSWDEAAKRLVIEKGRQFDPEIVDAFIDILSTSYNYQPSTEVLQLMELPPLRGHMPEGYTYKEGPIPSFS